MIVLDTNVVSEPMRASASSTVVAWLDAQVPQTLYLASTSLAELLLGVERLPAGRRKRNLKQGLSGLLDSLFADRLLAFDREAAAAFSQLVARARAKGVNISFADGQIAAVAMVRGFTVASRDVAPFEAAGMRVINPWESERA